MRLRFASVVLSLALSLGFSSAALAARAASPAPPFVLSKMLTDPALSAERIAFVYGNDIWTCRHDGSGVQRITSGPGMKMRPAFSYDGTDPQLTLGCLPGGQLDIT